MAVAVGGVVNPRSATSDRMRWRGDNREFQSYLRSKSLPPSLTARSGGGGGGARWRQDVYLYQPQLGMLRTGPGHNHEGLAAEERRSAVRPSIIGRAKMIFEATFRVERNDSKERTERKKWRC